MNDYLDEESKIIEEQSKEAPSFSFESFMEPISSMNLKDVTTLDASVTVGEAVALLQKKNFGSAVITTNGKVSGIITERDIMSKVTLKGEELTKKSVTEIMTKDPLTLRKTDEIAYLLNNMHVGGYRHIPIVDANDKPISIASIRCVMDYVIEHFPASVMNMVGEPFRGESGRDGA